MKTPTTIFNILLLLLLPACASNPPIESRRQQFSSAKSAVILSSVTNDVAVEYVGFTVFNNFSRMLKSPDAKIGEDLTAYAKSALGKKVEVKAAENDPKFMRVRYLPAAYRGLKPDNSQELIKPVLDQYLRQTPADLVLWIGSWREESIMRITNGTPYGHRIQAPLMLVLFDGKTGAEIYGKQQTISCDSVPFDYKANDLATELANRRQPLETSWRKCMEQQIDGFLQDAGLK
ncbi:MAG: hypothetical protein JNN20_15130 [Betaproteobacteria bacterium]|nr:hypothetical protein [Betaproteobacteria bacterium]